jgi:hypothetical protein
MVGSLKATTHAPHALEVEQILSNLMALFAARRASCDREYQGAAGREVAAKMRPKAYNPRVLIG